MKRFSGRLLVWCNLLPQPERANCASLGGSGVVAMVVGLWIEGHLWLVGDQSRKSSQN